MHRCTLESKHDLQSIAAARPGTYPYLLDSAADGPEGGYGLLFRSNGEHLRLFADGSLDGPGRDGGFLERLQQWYLQPKRQTAAADGCPFAGGWFLYLGYELAAEIEPTVGFPPAPGGFPVAFASRCPGVVYRRQGEHGTLHLAAESKALLQRMRLELESPPPAPKASASRIVGVVEEPASVFMNALRRVRQYILDGDVFQVNLSRGWLVDYDGTIDADGLFRRLRECNPAPFAGLARWGGRVLLSSSPERLVRVRNNVVETRPIAGTHPRGRDAVTDAALRSRLVADPKERAEHIMLIDLERNDLGRVCRPGSVEVDELMVVESYQHVHHIVSNVRGRLRPGATPVDAIRAVFPGGTITGCPKVRCMEIIAELEQSGRGYYTGSMGYLGLDGAMDLNILIRSMMVHGRQASFRTGAGIVADSDAGAEVAETRDKARGLLRALAAHGGEGHA
ncbi:MAG: aminodeoxychorismate synthase component I [Lysobacterales bacterium]